METFFQKKIALCFESEAVQPEMAAILVWWKLARFGKFCPPADFRLTAYSVRI